MAKDIDSLTPEETCFVISPIGEPNSEVRKRADQVFEHIIDPASEKLGLVAVRADHISTPGMITAQVIRHIINDRIVVADLSDHNANVFYELALRHAFRKPVVQLIASDQRIPFDVQGARTVYYELTLDGATKARDSVIKQGAAALSKGFEVESPVTIAARLEELSKSTTPQTEALMKAILDQIGSLNKTFSDMSGLIWRTEDLKQTRDLLQRYAKEIDLLNSVRYAGLIGVFKNRAAAIKEFSRFVNLESTEIVVIGSSLKGLLQKDEYRDVAERLRFKAERGMVQIKFLLTHPMVAEFRTAQESRHPTEIGAEVIRTLETLKHWNVPCSNVRLYLGIPTCFAMKTTRHMLINPYLYVSISYDSPCLILEYSPDSGGTRSSYFFDEFNSRHFGAWDTDLAVRITDYDETIEYCRGMLADYAKSVQDFLSRGRLSR